MTKLLTMSELDDVTGGNAWDKLDNGISKVWTSWKDKSCNARQNYVGWGIGTAAGIATAAAWPYLGPWAPAVIGPPVGLATTTATTSYLENCERKRAGGK